jgi:hypothetical protein
VKGRVHHLDIRVLGLEALGGGGEDSFLPGLPGNQNVTFVLAAKAGLSESGKTRRQE